MATLLFHGCLNAHKAHLQATVNSEPGGYGAGDQGGKFGLCMGLDAVAILGVLIHMAVCAR